MRNNAAQHTPDGGAWVFIRSSSYSGSFSGSLRRLRVQFVTSARTVNNKSSQQEEGVSNDHQKDSIQDEWIQKVSAPWVESGAANMTIPRRDLLTGTALMLVGEKLAHGDAQSGSKVSAPTGSASSGGKCRHPKPLRTPFMDDFTTKYIGEPTKMPQPGCDSGWPDPPHKTPPPTRVWPKSGQGRKEIADDYATFVHVLLSYAFVPGPQPPVVPNPTLAADVVAFLKQKGWPNGTPIPTEYQHPPSPTDERATVNLVEIAVIQDRLLQAINSFDLTGEGKGGDGSNWPPH